MDDTQDPNSPEAQKLNHTKIENDVMTVTIYLNRDAALAMALGALEMTKDLVKQHCMSKAMANAQRQAAGIIRPGVVH